MTRVIREDGFAMVFENASDDVPDSFTEDYGSSDTISDSSHPRKQFAIDTSNFPRPIPILGELCGYSQKYLAKVIDLRLRNSTAILKRPVTREEAEAISYWTAKQLSITSYGVPLGAAAGAWRTWVTRNTFRFPFYQPDMKSFDTKAFPSPARSFLVGAEATFAWHTTRFLGYAALGQFVGRVLFASYALSVGTVGEVGDSRLKNYTKSMREYLQGAARKRPIGPLNDASPANTLSTETVPDIGVGRDGDIDSREELRRWESQPSSTESEAPDYGVKTESNTESFNRYVDDASPTGGRGVAVDTESAGGSVWDRIRSQSTSENLRNSSGGSSWPSGQEPAQNTGRSAWPKSRRVTQMEGQAEPTSYVPKEEAQREFDARVERERRGGDFTSDGDQKRW